MIRPAGRCRYCEQTHATRFLCDPARRVLDALVERGMSFNMPTIEFPENIPGDAAGLDGMTPVRQLLVKAAVVDAAGVPRPAVLFTGRDAYGNVLPHWLYPADDEGMARLAALVADMTALAVRRAGAQRNPR